MSTPDQDAELGAAWREAAEAKPETWELGVETGGAGRPDCLFTAWAGGDGRVVDAGGSTPAEALRALAIQLRAARALLTPEAETK